MYRLMQPSDEAAVLALWQSQHHDTEDFAKMVLERFDGVQNIYVADENDAIVAAALAVPVTLQGRTGNYLCLCGEGSLLLAGLLVSLVVKVHLDNRYHPTWGDRPDGRKLRTLDPVQIVGNYIMPTRVGS